MKAKIMKKIRKIQGWALLLSTAISIFFLAVNAFVENLSSKPFLILMIVEGFLFILGISAVYAVQPQIGTFGKVGLILMTIPAFSQIGSNILLLQNSPDTTILTLVLLAPFFIEQRLGFLIYLGYTLVGWLIFRVRVFPAWAGWFFMANGILNIIYWFLVFRFMPLGSLTLIVYSLIALFGPLGLAGCGWKIIGNDQNSNSAINLKPRG